jgi:multidrug resistance efflux pump
VEVGTAVDGIVEDVLVKEGEVVERGTVIARLASSDVDAELRQVALDKARRDFDVSQSQVQEAIRSQHIIDAPPLKEDVTVAEAEVDAAAQHLRVLEEKLTKYAIRAPITGTVTRSYAQSGESFSVASSRPLFKISDIGSRRVRAQVDERDIASLEVGQNVEVAADAFASRTFWGTVIQIYPALGRKTVTTGDPAEKSDRDILEVLVRLQPDAKVLPLGLRVAVQFLERRLPNGQIDAREAPIEFR